MNTHPEQWTAIYSAAPGEQLGVRCLAQGHLSRGIEGGESTVHSLPPPTIPAGPETRTCDLRVTSPTPYPLGHDCPQRVSTEFKEFMNKNGIRHVTSAPFHASSNDLAERAVQTFKTMMKKAGEGSVASKVARVLFSYRITPQSTTGIRPAEMLLGRKLRSTLDLLHTDLQQKVRDKQSKQKQHHDNKWQVRSFQVGDAVLTRNFSYGPKWITGFIAKVTGPLSYQVMLEDGKTVRRHVDQILSQELEDSESKEKVCGDVSLDTSVCSGMDSVDRDVVTVPVDLGSQDQPGTVERETLSSIPEVRRSQRTVQKPKNLEDFVL